MFNTTGVLLIQTQEIFFKNTGLKKKRACNCKKTTILRLHLEYWGNREREWQTDCHQYFWKHLLFINLMLLTAGNYSGITFSYSLMQLIHTFPHRCHIGAALGRRAAVSCQWLCCLLHCCLESPRDPLFPQVCVEPRSCHPCIAESDSMAVVHLTRSCALLAFSRFAELSVPKFISSLNFNRA